MIPGKREARNERERDCVTSESLCFFGDRFSDCENGEREGGIEEDREQNQQASHLRKAQKWTVEKGLRAFRSL